MRADLARALAGGFLADEWTPQGLIDSGALVMGRRTRWMPALARQVLELYPRAPLDRPRELAEVIATLPAAEKAGRSMPVVHPVAPTRMVNNPWRLIELNDLFDVESLLGVSEPELAWFSDPRHLARSTDQAPLQHYRISTRTAASGAIRVLEAPKRRLKVIQRQLLDQVVGRIPPHDAAHGFRVGRSVSTYAAPHTGQAVVIRLDLEGFFASVTVGRVYGILRAAGYPEPVAHCLAGVMTTVLPLHAWPTRPAADRHRPARRALALGSATGHPPPAARGADLSGAGQPRRLPARRAAPCVGRILGSALHPLRR